MSLEHRDDTAVVVRRRGADFSTIHGCRPTDRGPDENLKQQILTADVLQTFHGAASGAMIPMQGQPCEAMYVAHEATYESCAALSSESLAGTPSP